MAWESLLATVKEAIAEYDSERSSPPVACPNDGEPLTGGRDGKLHCGFDGWTWPDDPNPLHGGQ
jgi:hypothetical protein